MLDRIDADGTQPKGLGNRGLDVGGTESLQEAQDLDVFALSGPRSIPWAHARLQQTAERGEGLRQGPTTQRSGLVQGTDLALEQRQVMERVEDQILALVGARVAGDDLRAAADHDPIDITADQDLAVAPGFIDLGGDRHRVVVGSVAHQAERAGSTGLPVTGVVGRGRQGQKGGAVSFQADFNRLLVAP